MRTRSLVCSFVAVIVLLVAAASSSFAAVPSVMNFQGRLFDDLGNPLNGMYDITFNLYDVDAGGVSLWTETHANVSVVDGLFNVLLGETVSLTDAEFATEERYLGIRVAPDAEQTPRIQLTSVGYAHRVSTVDGSTGGTITGDIVLESNSGVNGMEITQDGLGRGLRIGMNNVFSTETALAIATQSFAPAIQIVPDGGGPAISVIGGFGDQSIDFPGESISGDEITDSSVTSGDITNEAGGGQTNNANIVAISSGTPTSVGSITFTTPSAGWVLLQATAEATIVHSNGTLDGIEFGISAGTPNSIPTSQQRQWWIPSAMPSATYKNILTTQQILPVVQGNATYHVSASNAASLAAKSITKVTLSMIFIPTLYGEYEQN